MNDSTQPPVAPVRLADFLILGFPKCGTSALARAVGGLQAVHVDRDGASIEAPFFGSESSLARLRTLQRPASAEAAQAVGHKCTAYMYNRSAQLRIRKFVPHATLVVCVRDPLRALVSWREMHKRIAVEGVAKGHFVNENEQTRRFYIDASLEDYYRSYARERLRYAELIRQLRDNTGSQPLAIVSQEYMAAHLQEVLRVLALRIGVNPPAQDGKSTPHRASTDGIVPEGLRADSLQELAHQRELLEALLREWRDRPDTSVLSHVGAAGVAGECGGPLAA